MFHFGLRSNKRAGGRQLFSKSGGGGNEEETIDTWLLWRARYFVGSFGGAAFVLLTLFEGAACVASRLN